MISGMMSLRVSILANEEAAIGEGCIKRILTTTAVAAYQKVTITWNICEIFKEILRLCHGAGDASSEC